MMSSTNEADPFLQVQADVLSQLNNTRALFGSYLRIRSLNPSTSPSPELVAARADLDHALATLREDLDDLDASVQAVQADPYRYGLDVDEVARRRRLVTEVRGEVDDIAEELSKSGGGGGGGFAGSAAAAEAGVGDGAPDNDDAYEEFALEQQQRIMAEQDEQLDGVYRTVGTLRQQADDMGRELGEQAVMLESVDQLADRVGGRLQTGMRTMRDVIRQNEDRWSSCCIAVLIFVLILLLVLLLIL